MKSVGFSAMWLWYGTTRADAPVRQGVIAKEPCWSARELPPTHTVYRVGSTTASLLAFQNDNSEKPSRNVTRVDSPGWSCTRWNPFRLRTGCSTLAPRL